MFSGTEMIGRVWLTVHVREKIILRVINKLFVHVIG